MMGIGNRIRSKETRFKISPTLFWKCWLEHEMKFTHILTFFLQRFWPDGGPHSKIDSILALHPAAPGMIPGSPKNISEFLMLPRLIDGATA